MLLTALFQSALFGCVVKVVLDLPVLQKFPPDSARSYLVSPGESLKIPCRRKPHSVPEPKLSWFKMEDEDILRVEPSHKVTIGEDGEFRGGGQPQGHHRGGW